MFREDEGSSFSGDANQQIDASKMRHPGKHATVSSLSLPFHSNIFFRLDETVKKEALDVDSPSIKKSLGITSHVFTQVVAQVRD
jgi:hypothetical protein